MNDTTTIPFVSDAAIDDDAFQVDDECLSTSPFSTKQDATHLFEIEDINLPFLRAKRDLDKAKSVAIIVQLGQFQAQEAGEPSRPILLTRGNKQTTNWSSLFRKLDGFSDLTDGWNGYKAVAPSDHAISHARIFLEVLQNYEFPPTRVSPTAVGGVGITCRVGSRKVCVEFFNNSQISALFADDATETLHTQKVTQEDFENLVQDIEDYLNG